MKKLRKTISRNIARLLPDKLYLTLKFRSHMGYWMNWKNPQTYNEKLQWLKIYDKHPEYTKMVDKVAAKEYVASIIGEQYIIPTLAVYNSAEEINFDALPNQFVLKCTHDSGSIVVCCDKSKLDCEAVRKKMRKGLKRTYIIQNREYPYKNVPRRIIAEQYLEDEGGTELKDYKFMCFHGKVHYVAIQSGRRQHNVHCNSYDKDFNRLYFKQGYPWTEEPDPKPQNFEQMVMIAEKLSEGIPHVRVDLYNINGKIYFGELTFFLGSGVVAFEPKEWDYKIGALIHLPQK